MSPIATGRDDAPRGPRQFLLRLREGRALRELFSLSFGCALPCIAALLCLNLNALGLGEWMVNALALLTAALGLILGGWVLERPGSRKALLLFSTALSVGAVLASLYALLLGWAGFLVLSSLREEHMLVFTVGLTFVLPACAAAAFTLEARRAWKIRRACARASPA